MNLYALKSDYTIAGVIASNNVQWTRRYYKLGEFSIELPIEDYNADMYYVYMPERADLGVISKVLQHEEQSDTYIQISGYFAEYELNDKIIYPTFNAYGNIDTEIKKMIGMYKADVPDLSVDVTHNLGNTIRFQETGGELADVAYEKLKTQELSQRLKFDYLTGKKTYEIWQGRDLTQNQNQNNPVIFSTEFKTLTKTIVVDDWSESKNYAVVAGSGEGENRLYTNVDLSNGGYKKMMFVNASSIQYEAEKQTLSEYMNELKQYGLEKLLDHTRLQNVDAYADENSYEYMVDYDLGDKCSIVIDSLNLQLEARIICIYEVWKNNRHTIELEFGDKRLI